MYNDEGSRNYVHTDSVFNVTDSWLNRNERTNYTTGNLTYIDINTNQDTIISETNSWGDTITNEINSLAMWLPLSQKRVVYTSGISSFRRPNFNVSINPAAAFLYITQSGEAVTVDVQNLGPDSLQNVTFTYGISAGWGLVTGGTPPTTVAGNGEGFLNLTASKTVTGAVATATVSVGVTYTSVVGAESLIEIVLVT